MGKIPRKKRIKRIHIGEKRSSFPVSRVCEEKKKENHSRIIGWVLSANLCSDYKGIRNLITTSIYSIEIKNKGAFTTHFTTFRFYLPSSYCLQGLVGDMNHLLFFNGKLLIKSNNMLPNCYKDCFLFYFVQLFQLIG